MRGLDSGRGDHHHGHAGLLLVSCLHGRHRRGCRLGGSGLDWCFDIVEIELRLRAVRVQHVIHRAVLVEDAILARDATGFACTTATTTAPTAATTALAAAIAIGFIGRRCCVISRQRRCGQGLLIIERAGNARAELIHSNRSGDRCTHGVFGDGRLLRPVGRSGLLLGLGCLRLGRLLWNRRLRLVLLRRLRLLFAAWLLCLLAAISRSLLLPLALLAGPRFTLAVATVLVATLVAAVAVTRTAIATAAFTATL